MSTEHSAAPQACGADEVFPHIIPPSADGNTPDTAANALQAPQTGADSVPPGLAAGYRAIEAGLRAFPLRDKAAGLPKDWANTSACDRDALTAMWPEGQAGKDALCAAVMTPGFVAIDIDAAGESHPNIPEGNEKKAWEWLGLLTGDEQADTWTTATPSGGLHLVYRLRRPLAKVSVSGLLPTVPWRHVDIKAGRWKDETDKDTGEVRKRLSAGYVVAAGSPGYTDLTPEGITAPALAPEPLENFLHACLKATARHEADTFARDLKAAIEAGTHADWLADYLNTDTPTASAAPRARQARPAGGGEDGRGRAYALAALEDEAAELAATGEGGRNDRLNVAAFKLGRFGARGWIDEAEAREVLHEACVANGYIASDGEAAFSATFASGWSKGSSEPATLPEDSAATFTPSAIMPAHVLEAARSGEGPADGYTDDLDVETLWQARPWLAQVYRCARAGQLSPFAVLFAVLARVSAAVPVDVVAEHPGAPKVKALAAPLSLFVAIVGEPGSGKGSAGRMAAALVPDLRGATTTQPASGEGLAAMYVRRVPAKDEQEKKRGATRLECVNTAALLDVPEILHLGGVADRRGSTVVPALTSAWSGERLGAHNKAESDRLAVPAMAYRLSLVTGVQRGNARVLLSEGGAGLPQRFVWADTVDRTRPDTPPAARPEDERPLDLSGIPGTGLRPEARQAIYADTAGSIHPGSQTFPLKVVTFPNEVRRQAQRAALARLSGEQCADTGHAFQTRCRLAAILALMDGRLKVTMEDWELSGIMADYSERVHAAAAERQREADTEASAARLESRHDADLRAAQGCLLRWMARNPQDAPHTGSAILRTRGRYTGETAKQALRDAAERGLIECAEPVPATDPDTGETDAVDMKRSRWSLTEAGRRKYPPKK